MSKTRVKQQHFPTNLNHQFEFPFRQLNHEVAVMNAGFANSEVPLVVYYHCSRAYRREMGPSAARELEVSAGQCGLGITYGWSCCFCRYSLGTVRPCPPPPPPPTLPCCSYPEGFQTAPLGSPFWYCSFRVKSLASTHHYSASCCKARRVQAVRHRLQPRGTLHGGARGESIS